MAGPLVMSFEKNIFFFSKWRYALPAILIVAIPYIVWDALVTGSHWWFNEKYTLDFRLAGLPIEEWLFFVTVPFAALFIWEVIAYHFPNRRLEALRYLGYAFCLGALCGIFFFIAGREYTGLMFISLGAAAIVDLILKTHIFLQARLLIYLFAITALILVFNGYLTVRPVVFYGDSYQLGLRIGTIPVEDLGYGYSLILFATILYEKLKARANG